MMSMIEIDADIEEIFNTRVYKEAFSTHIKLKEN